MFTSMGGVYECQIFPSNLRIFKNTISRFILSVFFWTKISRICILINKCNIRDKLLLNKGEKIVVKAQLRKSMSWKLWVVVLSEYSLWLLRIHHSVQDHHNIHHILHIHHTEHRDQLQLQALPQLQPLAFQGIWLLRIRHSVQ